MEFEIKGTTLLLDSYGNLFDSSTKTIHKGEFIRIGKDVMRTKALIVNTYISYGRYDLLKNVDKTVYLITNPKGAKFISLNLLEFCKDHDLNYERMAKAYQLNHTTKCGWCIESLNNGGA